MVSRSLKVDPESKLHEDLVAKLTSRIQLAEHGQTTRTQKWRRAEELMLAYIPESDADRLRKQKRESGGQPRYTTIVLPYIYALVMSAHTYWTSVFFARNPVHQYTGRHGEAEMQVQALEALIAYQTEIGEMMAPYYIWLYDTGKYGIGVLGEYWAKDVIHYGEIAEFEMPDGTTQLFQATHEVPAYEGNRVYNVSPYDFLPDPRVPISRFNDGEFCIAVRRLGWHEILSRRDQGYFINTDKIVDHVTDKRATNGASALERPDFAKWTINDRKEEKHPAGAVFYECYVRLIPKEWGLGDSQFPQIWCISITEDLSLIIGASPLGYIHCRFPFNVLEPEVEAYGLYNRGIPEIMEPIQNTMDWLINTHFYNVRAAMNNQFIIDPSKIVLKDVANSGEPGFVWRLRPEAYGSNLDQIFKQVPVTDVTRMHMTDIQQMLQIGERTLGINDQIMGVLAAGGRKTATEVRTSTGFGVNRMKTITEYMSAAGLQMHAQKLVQNSQQFYNVEGKLRIVGDLAQLAGPAFINVTPELIAGFYSFVPVDGTLPIDRMAQANMWKEILIGATRLPPQVQTSYDFSKIFAWMASLGGLKNINQMRVQVAGPGMDPSQMRGPDGSPMAPIVTPPNPASLRLPAPGQGTPSASTTAGLNALIPGAGAPGATNGFG